MALKKYLIFILFLIFSASIFAQNPDIDQLFNISFLELLKVEIITATGTAVPLKKAPAVATIVTKEMIEASGATTLPEVLETVAGIHVIPSDYALLTPIWSVRGIQSKMNNVALLLINGTPLKASARSTPPFFFYMPVDIISKIEIIKGPGSAVHGADSFAVTVNVITKEGSEINGTNTGFRGGSFDTYSLWAEHGKQYGGWEVALGIAAIKTNGDDDRIVEEDYLHTIGLGFLSEAPDQLNTGYEILVSQLSLKNESFDINFFGFSINDAEFGHSGAKAIHKGSYNKMKFYSLDVNYTKENVLENFDIQLKINGDYQKGKNVFDMFPKAFLNVIGIPSNESLNGGFEIAGIYKANDSHLLRISCGMHNYDNETDEYKNFGPGVPEQYGSTLVSVKGTPYIYRSGKSRQLQFISCQDEWKVSDTFDVTLGVRYDDYSDFGETINPRLAFVWSASDVLTTKLLYGEAFRAPSFDDLYITNNPLSLGNPELDPEEIQTLELVFDYLLSEDIRLLLSVFGYEVEGLLEYVPDPGLITATAQNYKDQEGYGFELEAEWNISDRLQILANTAHQRSKDKDTDEITPYVPESQFQASLNWSFADNWFLNTRYTWIGNRHRADGDTRPDIDDYGYVNLTLRRKNVLENLDIAVSIRNLFDEDIREPSDASIPNDIPMEGRSVWGEVRYSM